jgi:hypothetical protein
MILDRHILSYLPKGGVSLDAEEKWRLTSLGVYDIDTYPNLKGVKMYTVNSVVLLSPWFVTC